jgi:hypothetical protein
MHQREEKKPPKAESTAGQLEEERSPSKSELSFTRAAGDSHDFADFSSSHSISLVFGFG